MKALVRSFTAGLFLLLLGLSTSNAQEVTFSAGPAVPTTGGAANGGFAWGDVNGDGNLDVFIPSSIIALNSVTAFTAASTMTVNVPLNTNSVGGLLADINGDGVLDLWTTNGGNPNTGLFYNNNGVLETATGTGDLSGSVGAGNVFWGMAVADINHSNYLSAAWPAIDLSGAYPGDGADLQRGDGLVLLKGGASGFTKIGRGAAAGNLAIDTSLAFESWDVRFFDANNDGYPDLLMPSFRHGYSRLGTGASGARKGCVLFINDGTGKFIVPTAASLGRTIYRLDSLVYSKVTGADSITYASANADTGIVVEDTVRHFNAIGNQWGDLNNDGNMDLILTGFSADNRDGFGAYKNIIILYGKGDGTFTYKWDGVHVVANGLPQTGSIRAWGIGDYNNDGKADIFGTWLWTGNRLFRNNGDGTFADVSTLDLVTGSGVRAGGYVDYNNDGFLDIFTYTGGSTTLLKNNGNSNKWIGFKPIGTGYNKSAVGARFTVYTGATKQVRFIRAEGGAAGQGGELMANFGLGTASKIDSVKVLWPDGTSQTYDFGASNNTIALNKYYTIQEGAIIPSAPLTMRPSWVAGDTSLASTDTLSWHRPTTGIGSITYQLQIASNAAFTTIAKTVSALTDTSTIVRLGLSTKYYWRVQAFENQVPGPYSAIDSFRTKVQPCTTTPAKLYPASKQTDVANKPTLKVSYVATASTYHFQIRGDSATGFNNTSGWVLNDSTSDFDTTWVMTTALTPSKTYYWRVRGYNPAGSSSWSPIDSFTIMFLPATPVKVYPTPNQANVSVNPLTLKWHHEAGDSNYVIQLWTYTTGGQVMMVDTTKHDTSWTIASGLLNRSYYYWKVQCYNQGGASAFSAVDSFTSVIELANPPIAIDPKGLAVPQPRRTTFHWNPAVNAQWYHLQIATASDFSTIVVDTSMIPDTTVQVADTLVAGTTYYYRLSSINLGGEGVFSGTTAFKTGTGVLGVEELAGAIPDRFQLFQNYPNPFNPATFIRYDVPKLSYVRVIIYDVLGRAVATLVDGVQSPRSYLLQWNAQRFSSGVYFCRIEARAQDGSQTFNSLKKLLLMK